MLCTTARMHFESVIGSCRRAFYTRQHSLLKSASPIQQISTDEPMSLRPLHDRVIVKRLDQETTTASGIVIPDSAAEKPDQGEVIAVGPGRKGYGRPAHRARSAGRRARAVRQVRGASRQGGRQRVSRAARRRHRRGRQSITERNHGSEIIFSDVARAKTEGEHSRERGEGHARAEGPQRRSNAASARRSSRRTACRSRRKSNSRTSCRTSARSS